MPEVRLHRIHSGDNTDYGRDFLKVLRCSEQEIHCRLMQKLRIYGTLQEGIIHSLECPGLSHRALRQEAQGKYVLLAFTSASKDGKYEIPYGYFGLD